MAGLLPGDPSHHGMVEMGPFSFSHDKLEELDRSSSNWYLCRKEIEENSPSRRDGIDLKKETYFRKSYCTFLQDLGMRLKVPQVTIATAIIFCHRFFLRQSHLKNDRRTIATVCMFLAGKVEETPRPLKDVILVSYEIIHKKDPAAIHKIKQKEVYEQQKELILLGERVVLATLGFDLNVHHPYKPLVEAIKKFKVAQNALAQVAWNFVNDGLRTSLCLQFKPHHIAAGAIFLAAKFLKVKLPSDGEKVWWQEFDVTPRQLEEVSNQMLELYEQNRTMPPHGGSEIEGSMGGSGANNRTPVKTSVTVEKPVSVHSSQTGGGGVTSKRGVPMPSTQPLADQLGADNKSGLNQNYDYGITEASTVWGHQVDGSKDRYHQEAEQFPSDRENTAETSKRSKFGAERVAEDPERTEMGETTGAGGRNLGYGEGLKGYSSPDVIKKIDKDKVKAALEKQRKARSDATRRMDLMDEDDLIERELENGVELAAEDEKIKRERRQSWSKPLYRTEVENLNYGKEQDNAEDKNLPPREQPLSRSKLRSRSLDSEEMVGNKANTENAEEGEFSLLDTQEFHSPKPSSRKRKTMSPEKQSEGKQWHDGRHSHQEIMDSASGIGRHDYLERDQKWQRQDNHV